VYLLGQLAGEARLFGRAVAALCVRPFGVVDSTGRRQLRLEQFKVFIQVIFGDLDGRKAVKQSSRRSFLRGQVHVAHPYQRNLPLIRELLVHHPLFLLRAPW
jgi:hypothetical protein